MSHQEVLWIQGGSKWIGTQGTEPEKVLITQFIPEEESRKKTKTILKNV